MGHSAGFEDPLSTVEEASARDPAICDVARGVEAKFHFDLLEAQSTAHQDLAHVVEEPITLVLCAQVIVQIDVPLNVLSAATALDGEGIETRGWLCRGTRE